MRSRHTCQPAASRAAASRASSTCVKVSRHAAPPSSASSSMETREPPQVNAKRCGGSKTVTSPSVVGAWSEANSIRPPGRGSSVTVAGNQWRSSSGSVTARHTASTGCSSRRSKRTAGRPSRVS